ncbi:uncharacterized protein N7487_009283 [Penicillium crustosum]|uniref:uncharacterized protein n=1 Tax=Penicillium crustosum TaxID=36656 RepID=UPI002397BD44|nr:uncharacterized protein N7487_009283 [Penicillium crustosum]KAJ5394980.1 hypothetical protein N7487_009283 [Penicillium crustosum]
MKIFFDNTTSHDYSKISPIAPKKHDKSGIRTHASCETRKLLLVVESRYTLTWRLRPTRPSYQ